MKSLEGTQVLEKAHPAVDSATNKQTQAIKGNELPRQTVPRAPGAESPALEVTLATRSALVVLLLLP